MIGAHVVAWAWVAVQLMTAKVSSLKYRASCLYPFLRSINTPPVLYFHFSGLGAGGCEKGWVDSN
jgi:hypothetical protein